MEQAVKYSRSLEEQGQASIRERDLLRQVSHLGKQHKYAKQEAYTDFVITWQVYKVIA